MYYSFFSRESRHTSLQGDWSSDVCSSDLEAIRMRRRARMASPPPRARRQYTPTRQVPRQRRQMRWERSEERRVGKERKGRWKRNTEQRIRERYQGGDELTRMREDAST